MCGRLLITRQDFLRATLMLAAAPLFVSRKHGRLSPRQLLRTTRA